MSIVSLLDDINFVTDQSRVLVVIIDDDDDDNVDTL